MQDRVESGMGSCRSKHKNVNKSKTSVKQTRRLRAHHRRSLHVTHKTNTMLLLKFMLTIKIKKK